MLRSIASIILVFVTVTGFGQTNVTDSKGRKQGPWKKKYAGSQVVAFEGTFKDDKPTGKFSYYFPKGTLKAVMLFSADGGSSEAKLYHPSGGIMGEGSYIGEAKDGAWVFYDEAGLKTSADSYAKGKKHGKFIVYFSDGSVAEEANWKLDLMHGPWQTFYETKQVRQSGAYLDGNLDGEYVKYYKNGKPLVKGKYQHAVKAGQWTFFEDSGTIDYKELWKNGKLARSVKENGSVTLFYASEKKKSEHVYRAGNKHGDFREWNDDGEFVTELRNGDRSQSEPDEYIRTLNGQTLHRKGNYANGKLHGKVTYYKVNSIKDKVETYENGELVKTENF
jgi:antitoxin component YwqK of YwqJK toxin-antitoxin module